MSVMGINDVRLPDDRPLTVDDLEPLPDDGNRYELMYGVLEVSPAPTGDHADALHRLEFLLEFHRPPELKVMRGQGVNLHGDPTRHRVPDTTVIRREDYEPRYQILPAVLAVEVASPGTALRDRNVKRAEYEEFGIENYWIVVPDRDHPSITAYELQPDGRYIEAAHVVGDEVFTTRRPFPFSLVPRRLVTEGEWRPAFPPR
ncbi:Uma2 family endonuclease [Actinomadura craniellae]|uniref:Uma2 family endonuclease n=1 Tax=Actinomadura craniellae TaxID=2231787 RepID=A0A365HBN2_9ACTN|nr:Uma2 family endonuclease [Actinomadura craniellae]RAY16432.1 Uma2 family endonuclease [Actinomadura craniellae]